ncbi:MAG: pyridoxal phosphate-dependent aminotransferase [Mycobacterium sp.]|nr:pyridoxal phosphate-dependent aminotransferase [Mycobacterium sp.]
MSFDFDAVIDRRGTWCTQWDYVADRFGVADLLPFTISDMDLPTAPAVIAALRARLDHPILGYSRWRNDDFLSAIEHWYSQRYDTTVDPAWITYAPSVIYQVARLIGLWSKPADGVVVHAPCYDAFPKTVAAAGRQLRRVPVGDWAALEAELCRPDTSVLLLCSPHNPTGHVWTEPELVEMGQLCTRHNVAVISDEIHSDLTHPPSRHRVFARIAMELPEPPRWAVVTSASKSFNIPALTGSYGLIADDDTRAQYLGALAGDGLSSPAVLALVATIAAYRDGGPWLDALRMYLWDNLTLVERRLAEAFPQLGWTPPQAGYLAWIDVSPLGIDDDALQAELIGTEKLAIMPGATYGSPGHLRLNVGCPRSKVARGVDGLIRALDRLSSKGDR